MKKLIKKIPIIGPLAVKWKKKQRAKDFESSEEYWKERYSSGGNSGVGSYDELAIYKAEVINEYVSSKGFKSIIEMSCGDGNQLSYFEIEKFTGYEISQAAVDLCKEKFKGDDSKIFRHFDEYKQEKADLTLSLDVVYCLVEDSVFDLYMKRLFDSAESSVLIFSTNYDSTDKDTTYIKHRKFTNWVEKNYPRFELNKFIENKYQGKIKPFVSDFYFFELKA